MLFAQSCKQSLNVNKYHKYANGLESDAWVKESRTLTLSICVKIMLLILALIVNPRCVSNVETFQDKIVILTHIVN